MRQLRVDHVGSVLRPPPLKDAFQRFARGEIPADDRAPGEKPLTKGEDAALSFRSFEPLRFVPKGVTIVLGLITTKTGEPETLDQLKRRIDEAARYAPLEQLALSPQCGFASGIAGNLLSEDQQWRKLEVMMQTAKQVWPAP